MAEAAQGRFLTGRVMGHVVRMTLTGATGITFVFLVDALNLFWVSQLGEPRQVAALGFAFSIQFLSVSTGLGMMIANTALVSRQIGRGDRARARRSAAGAMGLAFISQSLVAALIMLGAGSILGFAGAEGETLELARRYIWITMPSLPIMSAALIASSTLRAEGDGVRAMAVTISSGTIALFIDPVLILWLGLGIDGAAISVVVTRSAMCVISVWFVVRVHDLLARPGLSVCHQVLGPFWRLAWPAILAQMSAPVGNFILTSIISTFGDSAVAVWAVVNRLSLVAFGGIFSMAGAIGGIFGQNAGAQLHDRVKRTYIDALIFAFGYTLLVWLVLILLAPAIARAFALPEEGAEVFDAFIYIAAGSFVFTGIMFVANASFANLGRPGHATIVSWLRDGVLLYPLGWIMAGTFGAAGAVYGQSVTNFLVGVGAAIFGWIFVIRLDLARLQD